MNILNWKLIKRGLLPLYVLSTLLSSCSTEIDINAPNLNVPIVYCILNTEDTVQYVRVQKTYLVDQAALEFPPSADSIYFPGEVVIALERWENGTIKEVFDFDIVNDIPKDSGFFPVEKHVVFKTIAHIKPNQTYYLYVYLKDKESVLFAETKTVGNLAVTDPMDLQQRSISLNMGQNYITRWSPVENAGIYQVGVRFNYNEEVDGIVTQHSLDLPQDFTTPITNIYYLTREISGSRFFNLIATALKPGNQVVREATGIDFYFIGGGTEIKYYIESTQPTEGALLEKPVYSNFNTGIGLFSSMARIEVKDLKLATTTIDSLAYGSLTGQLGFIDHTGDRDSTNNPGFEY